MIMMDRRAFVAVVFGVSVSGSTGREKKRRKER